MHAQYESLLLLRLLCLVLLHDACTAHVAAVTLPRVVARWMHPCAPCEKTPADELICTVYTASGHGRYGAVFTVPMMGKNITFLVGPEAQAPFFKLNVS